MCMWKTERHQLVLAGRWMTLNPAVRPQGWTNEFRFILGQKILTTKVLPLRGESLICHSPKAKMNQERSNGTLFTV